jgi:hypothetical protein
MRIGYSKVPIVFTLGAIELVTTGNSMILYNMGGVKAGSAFVHGESFTTLSIKKVHRLSNINL